jgi:hypothetical protein
MAYIGNVAVSGRDKDNPSDQNSGQVSFIQGDSSRCP